MPGVPHTLTGKRLEVPLKRVFQRVEPGRAVNLGIVANPTIVQFYLDLARQRLADG